MASQFEKCREKIAEMQIIVQELCRLLYYKVGVGDYAVLLCSIVVQKPISADPGLNLNLPFLFVYFYLLVCFKTL